MHKPIMTCLSGMLLGISANATELTETWASSAELLAPESVIIDTQRDVLYVSNINGSPVEDDHNGFITMMDREGKILDLKKIEAGLSAPKGMTILNDQLYVADINRVSVFDLNSGEKAAEYVAEGATFLNDIDHDSEGNVYISDMMATTVYQIKDGEIAEWISDDRLASPNGLAVHGDLLLVGTWGKIDQEGFGTSVPGHIFAVSLSDKTLFDWGTAESVGNIDGLEMTENGEALLTDWMAGGVKKVTAAGDVSELLDLPQGSADFDYSAASKTLYIPMMMEGVVRAFKLTD